MKKNSVKVLLLIIISFVFAFSYELFRYNYRVIIHKSKDIKIVDSNYKNFDKSSGSYITKDKSNIIINTNSQYINKIKFDYKASGKDVKWNVSGYDTENNLIYSQDFFNDPTLNKSIKEIKYTVDKIKITFLTKNVKISNITIDNSISINWYRVLLIFSSIALIGTIVILRDYFKEKKEVLFLVIILTIGTNLIIYLPRTIHASWDDEIHFTNAYYLFDSYKSNNSSATEKIYDNYRYSQKPFISNYDERIESYKFLNKEHNKKFKEYRLQTISYKSLIYLPFAIGFKVGEFLKLPLSVSILLAKLFNLLLYALMIYWAIKIIPFGKNIVLCIALIPQFLFLATQFSYDPTIISGMILATSVFIYEMVNEDTPLSIKSFSIFLFSALWASFPKPVYIPIILLFLMLPSKKFKNKKQEKLFKLGIVLMFFIIVSSFVLPSVAGTIGGDTRGGDTDVTRQLSFILHNPISAVKLFFATAGNQILKRFLSADSFLKFGYLSKADVTANWYYIILITLIYFTLREKNTIKNFNNFKKLFTFIIFFMMYALIWLSMYLAFTPVGTLNTVKGVQDRYFFPITLLFFFLFIPTKGNKKDLVMKNEYLIIILYLVSVIESFIPILLF